MQKFIGEWFDTRTVLEETGQIESKETNIEEDSDYFYEQQHVEI